MKALSASMRLQMNVEVVSFRTALRMSLMTLFAK